MLIWSQPIFICYTKMKVSSQKKVINKACKLVDTEILATSKKQVE